MIGLSVGGYPLDALALVARACARMDAAHEEALRYDEARTRIIEATLDPDATLPAECRVTAATWA